VKIIIYFVYDIVENMISKSNINNNGFTLIEVLVVAALISLISSIVIAEVEDSQSSARDAQRKADLNSIRSGMAIFFDNNDRFPSSYTELKNSGTMANIPEDPSENVRYPFATSSTNDFDVCLAACVEEPAKGGGADVCDVDSGVTYKSNESYIKGGCDNNKEFYISF